MKVLIADDHSLYRAGMSLLLKDRLGVADVLEVGSLDEALDLLARQDDLQLALFDLSMPGMAGPEGLAAVKAAYPRLYVAIISGSEDRQTILACISAGLSGYIPKSLAEDDIARALQTMLDGLIYVPPLMMAVQQQPVAVAVPGNMPVAIDGLTPRQRDVLRHVVQGCSNKEIARQLDIAEGTVKIHLAALFAHFGAHNRTELAMRAQSIKS